MRLDSGAAHTRRLGICMCRARRIKVPIKRIIKRADDPVDVGNRRNSCDFFGADDFGLKPHIPVLCPLGDEHIKPILVVRKGDTADVVQPA